MNNDKTLALLRSLTGEYRAAAIQRARDYAGRYAKRVSEVLEAAGGDFRTAYPVPENVWAHDYKPKKAAHDAALVLVSVDRTKKSPMLMSDPRFKVMDQMKVLRFVAEAEADVNATFDAFLLKVAGKVGQITDATLTGYDAWGSSLLVVTKSDGTLERWRTQHILNTSKLGKVFSQWPTRKSKR